MHIAPKHLVAEFVDLEVSPDENLIQAEATLLGDFFHAMPIAVELPISPKFFWISPEIEPRSRAMSLWDIRRVRMEFFMTLTAVSAPTLHSFAMAG